jgi:apolipoprotein N-acyltransferase
MLLNPTNGSSYTGTILQSQQVASSRLRAVESGRWVAQVSPTGFSAFVSPGGDVHERTGVSERAVLLRELPLRGGETWYTTQGDWPIEIVVAVALAISLIVPARARRGSSLATAGPPPAP